LNKISTTQKEFAIWELSFEEKQKLKEISTLKKSQLIEII
jgi:hypothetical protein